MPAFDYYLIIDFEASGHVRDSTEWEIVEFPIVVVNSHEAQQVVYEFHQYVKPTRNPMLSDFCTQSCGISQCDVDNAATIDVVVCEAIAWVRSLNLSGKFAVVTCGDYDLKTALWAESQKKNFPLPDWLRSWVNIKVPFANRFGKGTGMKGMLSRLNLTLDGRHHCGLDDARNIAKIVVELLKLGEPLELTGTRDASGHLLASRIPELAEAAVEPLNIDGRKKAKRWRSGAELRTENTADPGRSSISTNVAATNPVVNVSVSPEITPKPSAQQSRRREPIPKVRIDEPWLSWLVSGPKTHEGRVFRGTWAKLAEGDRLIACSSKYAQVDLTVVDILRFNDFDSAFATLGERLVPEGATTPGEALKLYRQWNSSETVRQCGGVVAMEVKVGDVQLRPLT